MKTLFPMFVKLDGREVLVVGAGRVGEPKIRGLLPTGAKIRVVAHEASEVVQAWARIGEIIHGRRSITPETAIRLARYLGTTAEFWLGLQARYDLEAAEDIALIVARQITPKSRIKARQKAIA